MPPEMALHRVGEQGADLLAVGGLAAIGLLLEGAVPVRDFLGGLAVGQQVVAGAQTAHAFEEAVRLRHHEGRQVVRQRGRIEVALDLAGRQQRLDLRGEQQGLSDLGVDHGLDTQPVAGDTQPPPWPIPDREREHAVDLRHDLGSPLRIAAQNHLGVAARAEDVTVGFEPGPHLGGVEDLAVVDDRVRAVLGGHRLRAAGDVDDREPAVREADRRRSRLGVKAGSVGAAMGDARGHALEQRRVDRPSVTSQDAGDPAHVS
jgi:hypothetical protein